MMLMRHGGGRPHSLTTMLQYMCRPFATRSRCELSPGTSAPGFAMPPLRGLNLVILLCLLALLVPRSEAQAPVSEETKPKADVIFEHANVYTGVPANAQFSSIVREEAIAVRGDRIQAAGKTADMEKLKGPQTLVVDLGGHFVMPGFNDSHLPLDDAGTT